MGRKSKQVINAEINRIRRYLDEHLGESDPEIIQGLGVKERTYYHYKERIDQQDKEAWLEIAKESLESAAFKVKQSLDYCIKISKDVAANSADQKSRLEAAKKVVECRIMAYKLLEKGPTSKSITIPKIIQEDGRDRRLESTRDNGISIS